jgi:hypothetical protein
LPICMIMHAYVEYLCYELYLHTFVTY